MATANQIIEALRAVSDARIYRRRGLEAAANVDVSCTVLEVMAWGYCIDAPDHIPAGSMRGFSLYKPVVRTALRDGTSFGA